jgi:hypothetical protein
MSSQDDSGLLNIFLFHLRTPLSSIRSASQVAIHMKEKVPANLFDWLEKWKPLVERWIAAEENAHKLFSDGEKHDWERVVYDMAKDMKEVSIALSEGLALEVPDSPESEMILSLTLKGGFNYLNGIIQPILNRDFKHLLN